MKTIEFISQLAINLRSPGNDEFYPIGVGIDERKLWNDNPITDGENLFSQLDRLVHPLDKDAYTIWTKAIMYQKV